MKSPTELPGEGVDSISAQFSRCSSATSDGSAGDPLSAWDELRIRATAAPANHGNHR